MMARDVRACGKSARVIRTRGMSAEFDLAKNELCALMDFGFCFD